MLATDVVTLDTVAPGTTVLIRALKDTDSVLYKKLVSMGLVAGRKLTVTRRAPFGDPIAITTLGYMLSLRLSEARQIEVAPS